MSPPAKDAAAILGQQVRLLRRERKWTAAELATRAGVSLETLASIESGRASVAIGNVLNVATMVGVPLFGAQDEAELARMRRAGAERVALLPTRVRATPPSVSDADLDF